jgi:hypothetical protein
MVEAGLITLVLASLAAPQPTDVLRSADELVHALRQFPAVLPLAPSDGVVPRSELLRQEIYDRLWSLGPVALPALCRGLDDPDVQVRRNVALFLGVAGGDWYWPPRPALAIQECVPALVRAVADPDGRVRGLAAQAVGATGSAGESAVPCLIELLNSPSEGDRNSACSGLGGIGPAARMALPALGAALLDPSPDVQRFADWAIERIDLGYNPARATAGERPASLTHRSSRRASPAADAQR